MRSTRIIHRVMATTVLISALLASTAALAQADQTTPSNSTDTVAVGTPWE